MIINKNFHEKSLILILLSITLFFIFWIIPESIEDPENFGLQDGLNPSFAPYLIGFFAFFTLKIFFSIGLNLPFLDTIESNLTPNTLFKSVFSNSLKINVFV